MRKMDRLSMAVFVVFLAIIVLPPCIFAQRKGQVGLNLRTGGRSSIGRTFHVAENHALRPAIILDIMNQTDQELYIAYGVGITYQHFFDIHEKLAIYLGPEFTYRRTDQDTFNQHDAMIGLLPGIQYSVSRKFSIYGEINIINWQYIDQAIARIDFSTGALVDVKNSIRRLRFSTTNVAIGLIFFLNSSVKE